MNQETYIIFKNVSPASKQYSIITIANTQVEIEEKHTELLKTMDPNMLNISKICPVVITTSYNPPDIGIDVSWPD